MIRLFTVLLATALLAGCGGQVAPAAPDYRAAAREAASRAQGLTSFSESTRLDFAFIHASHADDASLVIQATAAGTNYQLSLERQGMGRIAQEQWIYEGGALYRGDGTVWKTVNQSQADLPQPPRSLLSDLKSFEVTGAGQDLEWGGTLCRSYTVSSSPDVVWIYAPAWLRELDTNLDFRCNGELYVGKEDGLPDRIFLRLEGTDHGTGLLKLSVNLDTTYTRFNDPELKVSNPMQQAQQAAPGS